MSAKAKKKKEEAEDPNVHLGIRIPRSYKEWLLGRLKDRPPGFLLSDEIRAILKAEKDREDARAR